MRLLMKVYPVGAFTSRAAHIPGGDGYPLCHTRLKFVDWAVQEQDTAGVIVCNKCRKRAAKLDA